MYVWWTTYVLQWSYRGGGYNRAVTIAQLSKIYGLYIEIWSEEDSLCFEEHYKIINGKVITNEEFDITNAIHYLDCFDNYEEYKESYGDNALLKDKFDEIIKSGDTVYYSPYYYMWDCDDNYVNAEPNHLVTMNMCKLINK